MTSVTQLVSLTPDFFGAGFLNFQILWKILYNTFNICVLTVTAQSTLFSGCNVEVFINVTVINLKLVEKLINKIYEDEGRSACSF